MENVIIFLIFAVFTVISVNKKYNKASNKNNELTIVRLYTHTSLAFDLTMIGTLQKNNTSKEIDHIFFRSKREKINYFPSYFERNINSTY